MLSIYKSPESRIVYLSNGNFSNSEDFTYNRNGDLFTIKRTNAPFNECDGLLYSEFIGKDSQGADITFASAGDLVTYLDDIFTQQSIEEGTQGPEGPQGIQGEVGPQGATGPQGIQGLTGPAGADGQDGAQGPQGLTGPAGPAGSDGADGPQGFQGIQGIQGDTGVQGPEGPQGPAGADGQDGRNVEFRINVSVLEFRYVGDLVWIPLGAVVGSNGATGPQGPQGLQGPAGNDGAQGIQGIQGPQGPAGSGSSGDYASFYLGATGGQTGLTNSARTLTINNTRENTDPLVFVLLANEVTVNKTGNFKISFDTYINNSSCWLEINGAELVGSRFAVYQRGYDSGGSTVYNDIIPLVSGQTIRFRIQRTDGGSAAGYQDANGTRLTIEEK